jgi:hypothetical protein
MVPDGEGGEEPIANEKDYSIVLQMPKEVKRRLVRIPRVSEWPFFKQLMDNMIGEHEWVAGFLRQIWNDCSRFPTPGQVVDVHWVNK